MTIRYLAHPVRPQGDETLDSNVERALRWYLWLLRKWPQDAVVAPWISEVQLLDEADDAIREAGLRRCELVVARCDALVLCGPRVSSGMERERQVALRQGLVILDITGAGEPPEGEG